MEISKNKKQKRDDFWPWEIPNVISKEEEIELATRSMNGDIDARMKLITSNMRIVISLAYSMGKSDEEIKECISEGMMGATIAASRYDPSFNVRFCTYAMWWVRAHIVKYKKHKRGFYLPHKYFQILKELSKLYTKTGKNYTDDLLIQEVSNKFGLKQERVKDILKMSMIEVSLEDKTTDDKTIFDVLPSETLSPALEFFNKEDSLKNISETPACRRAR
jgi:RNA polymerase primary sigma factor